MINELSLANYPNVRGDGLNDDTQGIRQALQDATGKRLFVPKANNFYKVGASLTLPSGITLVGEGERSLFKKADSGSFTVFTATNAQQITLTQIAIDGNKGPGDALALSKCKDSSLNKITLNNAQNGLNLDTCDGITATEILAENNSRAGIYALYCDRLVVSDNKARNNAQGLWVAGTWFSKFSDNDFQTNAVGIRLGKDTQWCSFVGNRSNAIDTALENASKGLWHDAQVSYVGDSTLYGFCNCVLSNNIVLGKGILLALADKNLISGNRITNEANGILLYGSSQNVLSHNEITNAQNGVWGIRVFSDAPSGVFSGGLAGKVFSNYNKITDNLVFDSRGVNADSGGLQANAPVGRGNVVEQNSWLLSKTPMAGFEGSKNIVRNNFRTDISGNLVAMP